MINCINAVLIFLIAC